MEIKGLAPDLPKTGLTENTPQILSSQVNSEKSVPDFSNLLQQAVRNVNEMQNEASGMMEKIETGESKDLMGAMVSIQKASLSFQALMQVRNKAIAAYEEIMRMQV